MSVLTQINNIIMKLLQRILFGERVAGEKLAPPTVTTSYPDDMPEDFNTWAVTTFNQLRDKRKVSLNKKKVAYLIKKS